MASPPRESHQTLNVSGNSLCIMPQKNALTSVRKNVRNFVTRLNLGDQIFLWIEAHHQLVLQLAQVLFISSGIRKGWKALPAFSRITCLPTQSDVQLQPQTASKKMWNVFHVMKEKINLRNPVILEHGGLNGKGFKNKCATKSSIASSGNVFDNRCADTQRFASLQMERKLLRICCEYKRLGLKEASSQGRG